MDLQGLSNDDLLKLYTQNKSSSDLTGLSDDELTKLYQQNKQPTQASFGLTNDPDDEIKERGTILPFGITESGKRVPALPEMIMGPARTVGQLMTGQKTHRDLSGADILELGGLGAGGSVASRAALSKQAPITAAARGAAKAIGGAGRGIGRKAAHPFRGTETKAQNILQKNIKRSGRTADEILGDYNQGQTATKFGGNSNAHLPETLADVGGTATQNLLEQTILAPGRARSLVKERINAKQRGVRAPYSTEALPNTVTKQQGLYSQRDRVLDNVARSFKIKTKGSAIKTEKQIKTELVRQAKPIYKQAFEKADDFDLLGPMARADEEMAHMSGGILSSMRSAKKLFMIGEQPLSKAMHLKKFDSAKKALDDMISIRVRQGRGEAVRALTSFKNDLLDAVHGGSRAEPTRNMAYSDARQLWTSGSQMQNAINKGRNAFKEGAEVTAEQVANMTKGERNLFRIGLYEAIRKKLGNTKATDNATIFFRRAEVADIIKAAAPRGKKIKPSDQFGELLNREHRMVETRDMLKNSRTAFRLEGKEDFDLLTGFTTKLRKEGLASALIDTASVKLQEKFAMREKVAARLADLLTDPDPEVIRKTLKNLSTTRGPKQAREIAGEIAEIAGRMERTAAIKATEQTQEQIQKFLNEGGI